MNRSSLKVLLVDDDADERLLIEEAYQDSGLDNEFTFVESGEQLMNYLQRKGEYAGLSERNKPGLILLDLNMPGKVDGREALKLIKAHDDLRRIPVVVLTTSEADQEIFRAYDSGVNSYINKPPSVEGMSQLLKTLVHYWSNVVEIAAT